MSWQSYVDDHLMCHVSGGNTLTAAAIVGQDGLVWAQSGGFPEVTQTEIANIVEGFEDNSTLPQHGLFLGGTKYMVIQGDPGAVIRGKKGQGGVTVKKTNSALVIGIYNEPITPGECNIVVERLGDYLVEQGI
ncbi:unnamed protein product [Sphagnum jensenii]|uniref:Profilin n=1 Tax=Sphagnum jensenii TaxID=128206 RepID=A0ABP1B4H7_9BRYO